MSLIAGPSHMTTHILDWYLTHTNSAFLVASCWFFSSSFRTKELSSTFFLCNILTSWLLPFESYERNYTFPVSLAQFVNILFTLVLTNISMPHLKAPSENIDNKTFCNHCSQEYNLQKHFHTVMQLPFFKISATISRLSDIGSCFIFLGDYSSWQKLLFAYIKINLCSYVVVFLL